MERRQVLQSIGAASLATLIGVNISLATSQEELDKKWEYKSSSPYITAITANDSHIYFGEGGQVTSISRNSGDQQWSTPVNGGRVFNVPTIGSTVYGTSFQKVVALDKRKGAKEWSSQVATGATSQPVKARGNIVVSHDQDFRGPGTCGMKAFHPDGEALWEISLSGGKITEPLARNGSLFVGTSSGDVYRINASTGDEVWQTNLNTPITLEPAYLRGGIHVVDETGTYYALDKQGGEIETELPITRPHADSRIVLGKQSIIIPGTSGVSGINPESNAKWSYSTEASVVSTTVKNNTLYFGDVSGGIHQVRLETGEGSEITDFSAIRRNCSDEVFEGVTGHPLVAGNTMVVPRSGGIITAFTLNN